MTKYDKQLQSGTKEYEEATKGSRPAAQVKREVAGAKSAGREKKAPPRK